MVYAVLLLSGFGMGLLIGRWWALIAPARPPRSHIAGYYLWALVACPTVGAALASANASSQSLAFFIFAFFLVPTAFAAGGSRLVPVKGTHVYVGTLGAALLGGVAWVLLIAWAASRGLYE